MLNLLVVLLVSSLAGSITAGTIGYFIYKEIKKELQNKFLNN